MAIQSCDDLETEGQGNIQKYFEGGALNLFVWTGKFRGFWDFFLKNPRKLKKIPKEEG